MPGSTGNERGGVQRVQGGKREAQTESHRGEAADVGVSCLPPEDLFFPDRSGGSFDVVLPSSIRRPPHHLGTRPTAGLETLHHRLLQRRAASARTTTIPPGMPG
jgi:hypothetical protein